MNRRTARAWAEDGFDLISGAEEPYYLIGFTKVPEILPTPLILATGDTLRVGDTLAYLGGDKTSAGFDILHPVAPYLFEYAGMIKNKDVAYALWKTPASSKQNDRYTCFYFGHSLLIEDDIVTALLFTNRAGSGRVIEAKIFHSTHEAIPDELYPSAHQKHIGLNV